MTDHITTKLAAWAAHAKSGWCYPLEKDDAEEVLATIETLTRRVGELEAQPVGHKTMEDGSHEPLTRREADELWDHLEYAKARRTQLIPDETAALIVLMEAYKRLIDLGWSDAIYCPKDGSTFQVIEAGSTGIHDCHYDGEWPKGSWWVSDGGDLWPSRPILFRHARALLARGGKAE